MKLPCEVDKFPLTMRPPYRYAAEAVHVVDGYTIDVILDFGFSLKQKMRLRLSGIDTPELRSVDKQERERAQAAKEFTRQAVFASAKGEEYPRPMIVRTIKTKSGKERQTFGRYVAEVYTESTNGWTSLNEALVVEGHAVRSTG